MKVIPSVGVSLVTKLRREVPAILRAMIEPITPASANFNKLMFFRLDVLRFAFRLAILRAMEVRHYEASAPKQARLRLPRAGF